jgi:hypothetical protein
MTCGGDPIQERLRARRRAWESRGSGTYSGDRNDLGRVGFRDGGVHTGDGLRELGRRGVGAAQCGIHGGNHRKFLDVGATARTLLESMQHLR